MSLYRCSECRNGRRLYAWAQSCSYGPLHADGELASHEAVEDCFLFVDSIQCAVHPDAGIETKINGRFHVWATCEGRCGGEPEKLRDRGYYGTCPDCGSTGGNWVLADSSAARRPA